MNTRQKFRGYIKYNLSYKSKKKKLKIMKISDRCERIRVWKLFGKKLRSNSFVVRFAKMEPVSVLVLEKSETTSGQLQRSFSFVYSFEKPYQMEHTGVMFDLERFFETVSKLSLAVLWFHFRSRFITKCMKKTQ